MGSGLCARLWVVAQTVGSGLWRAKSFFSCGPKLSAILLDSGRFRRSKTSHLLDCGLWALCGTVGGVAQTVGSGLWRAKSFFSSGRKLPFKPLKPLKRFDTCQWFCHTSGFWTLQTLHGRFRRSKTSHLLDCGLWALRETVGGVAQTVGSGLWRAKSFFSSGPKLPFKPLKPLKPFKRFKRFGTCQWFCHTSGFWTLQTLQNLALARLWALGSVRDCGRSCADCGLGALARQVLFFLVARNCLPKPRACQTVGSGLCARLWAELRRLWARGSGAPNTFF